MSAALSRVGTLLPIINACDNFKIAHLLAQEACYPFFLSRSQRVLLGLVNKAVIIELERYNASNISEKGPIWDIIEDGEAAAFAEWLDTPETRSAAMQTMCIEWRDKGVFGDIVSGR
jgi:hypothetical protein